MDRFVALGPGVAVLSSFDGLHWSQLHAATGVELSGVAFGNDRFVVVGRNGVALVSTNLLDWTRHSMPGGVARIKFVHDRFFAMGGGAALLTSFDGQNWTSVLRASQVRGITYGNGRYVVIGYGDWQGILDPPPPYGAEMFYSTNGFDWMLTRQSNSPKQIEFHDVAFGHGSFLAAASTTDRTSSGFIARSTTAKDGTWTSVHHFGPWAGLNRMEFLGGKFLGWAQASFTGGLFISTNGFGWDVIPDAYGTGITDGWHGGADMAFGNGSYVVVSGDSAGMRPRASTNLVSWREAPSRNTLTNASFGQIVRGANGYFLPGGSASSGSAFSPNGRDWKLVATARKIDQVAYGNGGYWGVDFRRTIVFSSDGVNWRERSRMDPLTQVSIIGASDTHVIIGGSKQREPGSSQFDRFHAVSSDGRSWEPVSGLGEYLLVHAPYFENGMLVGLGTPQAPPYESRLFTSTNHRHWQAVTTIPEPIGFAGFFAVGGRYVLSAGPNHAPFCLISTNLIDWPRHATPARFTTMVYGEGVYVAQSETAFWSSTDLRNWTRHILPVGSVYGLAYGEARLMATGPAGRIYQSGRLDGLHLLWLSPPDGSSFPSIPLLLGPGWTGPTTIEASSDLQDWRILTTLHVDWTEPEFKLPELPRQQFYRARR